MGARIIKPLFKIAVVGLCVLALLAVGVAGTDYRQTMGRFEKPVFARCRIGFDDGGSGTYRGIGYSIEIKGNFMPEDEFPGVTSAKFRVLGIKVSAVTRD
jgi:hypothetical protein